MFSPDSTLDEFTSSIEICQPEADLGTILGIFQQTDCNSIAIPGKNNTWGVICSHNLLSLLAKFWQKSPWMMVSHPKNSLDRDNFAPEIINDLEEAIEPAIVCQGQTRLAEFLSSLQDDFFQTPQGEYLIVNAAGQLKGRLDKEKLLKYLASRWNLQSTNTSLSGSFFSLLNLFDNLTLPIKIETSARQDCYANYAWRKLVSSFQEEYLDYRQKSNVSIAHWWMTKQFSNLPENSAPHITQEKKAIDNSNFCCLLDPTNFFSPTTTPQRQDLQLQQSAIQCIDRAASPLPEKLSLEIEKDNQWDYIKIPLIFNQEYLKTEEKLYWLVLAVESSLLPNKELSEIKSNVYLKASTVERLLATVAHELKSPLTGILGLSKLLNSDKIGTLNQRQSFYLRLIYNSGNKLTNIVSDLIELTSLTEEKLKLIPEAIDLELLCRQLYQKVIIKLKSLESGESNSVVTSSKLELNIDPEVKIAVIDKLRVSSILTHLILETIQSCDLSFLIIKITIKAESAGLAIAISNKFAHTLSSPLENSNSFSRGMSLNLVIANYLAEIVQGEIKSNCGNNCCSFTLLLPNVLAQTDRSSLEPYPTVLKQDISQDISTKNLTILCLYPEPELIDSSLGNNSGLDFNLKTWAEEDWSNRQSDSPYYRYRIIEADGLEQAHTLARIWQLDAIVLDGYQISNPEIYLQSLQESECLSSLPIIALDAKTSAAANQVKGLNIYPCLIPAECRSVQDLMQVIQIATGNSSDY